MKMKKLLCVAAALALTLACCVPALADSALVVTPKGPLNLRKSPTTDSNRIASIPNHSIIEILDVDGDWAKAVYNDKTGFVKTEFLRIESQIEGKTVYPNDYATVMLREEPSASGKAIMPADNLTGVIVESIEDGWAAVTVGEEATAFTDLSALTYQIEAAPKTVQWMAEGGTVTQDCTVRMENGEVYTLPAGTRVVTTEISNIEVLAVFDGGCGYVPMAYVALDGPIDNGETTGSISPEKAISQARDIVNKSFKGVANERLTARAAVYYDLYGFATDAYQVGFFRENGEYAYGVLVNGTNGKILYKARYSAFASPAALLAATPEPIVVTEAPAEQPAQQVVTEAPAATPAPTAEPEATPIPVITEIPINPLSRVEDSAPADDSSTSIAEFTLTTPAPAVTEAPAQEPAVEAPANETSFEPVEEGDAEVAITDEMVLGDVLDIEVSAWTDYQVSYTITRDGARIVESGPDTHFAAAYRPRSAGDYTLLVDIADEAGKTAHLEIEFNVAEADTEGLLYDVYSQKDGWWADRSFYTSTMEADGAAIFAQTLGLARLGVDSIDILPENMSMIQNFTECLTENGVDNAKLVAASADYFGIKTQADPITDPAVIREKLQQGAVFTFTNEGGNVVLATDVSEDGSMVRIVDAAPSLSFEGIAPDTIFFQQDDGSFAAATALEDSYECRWYFEKQSYGGMEYWQKLETIAPQGLLLMEAAGE